MKMYSSLSFPRAIYTSHVVFIDSNLFVGLLSVSSRIYAVRFFFKQEENLRVYLEEKHLQLPCLYLFLVF